MRFAITSSGLKEDTTDLRTSALVFSGSVAASRSTMSIASDLSRGSRVVLANASLR